MHLHVTSTPYPDRVDEFDRWYSEVHVPDMLAVPAVKSCSRFRLTDPDGPVRFLAVYAVDGDDPAALLAELGACAADGRIRPGTASDPTATRIEFWKSWDAPSAEAAPRAGAHADPGPENSGAL
ncbi:hypothetical protein ABZ319_01355 [Nocardia sp. NPDC005978]|uniref:hypothetical protein n=1 Tax=Nocardia sp. NPDC005978 TaxID=3156725 RepID=UPI0033B89F4B